MTNLDERTIAGFNSIWKHHRGDPRVEGADDETDSRAAFDNFFLIFPIDALAATEGFDLGCGGGRIAQFVAPRVGRLHCIDAAPGAIAAARDALRTFANVEFHQAPVSAIPLADESQDFGYSLGVLHHLPDPEAGLRSCVAKLKPGAPFLLYVYYRFDDRPAWFRLLWRASDVARRGVSKLPFAFRRGFSDVVAALAYWPLSRTARLLERSGRNVDYLPLSFYRRSSWATLRADSLDRFATPLEHRFTRNEVAAMMTRAGLTDIRFREGPPYWVAVGWKA
jgi:SAM-dependent methyltransferase